MSSVSSTKSVSVPPLLLHFRVKLTSHIPLDSLFNLGKAEGSIDAGQMIKPALARGLQLVGATTRMDPRFPPPLAMLIDHPIC